MCPAGLRISIAYAVRGRRLRWSPRKNIPLQYTQLGLPEQPERKALKTQLLLLYLWSINKVINKSKDKKKIIWS